MTPLDSHSLFLLFLMVIFVVAASVIGNVVNRMLGRMANRRARMYEQSKLRLQSIPLRISSERTLRRDA